MLDQNNPQQPSDPNQEPEDESNQPLVPHGVMSRTNRPGSEGGSEG